MFVISPKDLPSPAPCLVNFHGGGFVFEGYNSHYQMAMTYAREGRCKVIYVRYRLALKHPFPIPQEDCYAALCWVYDHAEELGIDRERIGVGGDSAGGTLSIVSDGPGSEGCCEAVVPAADIPLARWSRLQRFLSPLHRHAHVELHAVQEGGDATGNRSIIPAVGLPQHRGGGESCRASTSVHRSCGVRLSARRRRAVRPTVAG